MHVAGFCARKKVKRFHYVSTAYVAGTEEESSLNMSLRRGRNSIITMNNQI
ncbi:SDR family oxidoreductase [Candidatus Kuenenia stuttgartiensis]|uniref:SDR family oxidoreductase n=1 Tax=Kuenenia stuttgartiensis TaxID=174633 RepID=UPI00146C74C5